MEITRLPIGTQAPPEADCLRIEEQPDGSFTLTASALCAAEDDAESASIVGGLRFETTEQAEAAGLAWAESVGARHIYVATGTAEQPLELTEIDLPL